MIEILALIFLTRQIGDIATAKGLKPGRYKVIAIVLWFVFELIGVLIGVAIFGELIGYILGIGGAYVGYLVAKSIAENAAPSEGYVAEMATRPSAWTCPACGTANTMFDRTCSNPNCYEKQPVPAS